jgi:nucleotide-binding universal stress UspA family protein
MARDMVHRLQEAGLEAVPERRDGDPAEQIVRAAESWEADLVVMGNHGRTGLRRLLMGSVARNVLLHAPCSVLIVREQPADEEAPPGIA